jgi:hypothetical protein
MHSARVELACAKWMERRMQEYHETLENCCRMQLSGGLDFIVLYLATECPSHKEARSVCSAVCREAAGGNKCSDEDR